VFRSLILLAVSLSVLPITRGTAQAPPTTPLHIVISHSLTPITAVLTTLSRQSGVPILADDTVIDTLGVADIAKPTLPEMLDAITALAPAETWQRVTIPSDAPLPDADSLSAQVRDLQTLMESRVTITDPGTHTTVSYSRVATDTSKFADTTDRTVYLVTNETVRAQRIAEAKARAAKALPDTPLKQIDSGMAAVQNAFTQMTPAEQYQGVMKFSGMMGQLFTSLDPSVMAKIQQQAAQYKGGMGNGQNPPSQQPTSVPATPGQ
jgi:hypothetical protein